MEQDEGDDVIHLILCYAEDSSGGVSLLEARKRYLDGKPKGLDMLTDIQVYSTHGHHGYKEKLFKFVTDDVEKRVADAKSQYGNCEIEVEVWVNVDADKMSEHSVTPEDVAQMALRFGFRLSVNRENLEGEVLRILSPDQEISHAECISKINETAQELNMTMGEFSNDAMKLPKYDKNRCASDIFFERLTVLYPELIEQYIAREVTSGDSLVKTLADLLVRFDEIYP